MPKFTAIVMDWTLLDRDARWDISEHNDDKRIKAIASALAKGQVEIFDLEAQDYNDVYRILNVAHPADYKLRSLSVGDVIMDHTTREVVQVSPVGFAALSKGLSIRAHTLLAALRYVTPKQYRAELAEVGG